MSSRRNQLSADVLGTTLPALPSLAKRQEEWEGNLPAQPRARLIRYTHLSENPDNPRRRPITDEDVAELAASILEKGVLEPLGVRHHPEIEGHYLIVYGSRRYQAIDLLVRQHPELLQPKPDDDRYIALVPCVILKVADDEDAFVLAVAENAARDNLTGLELWLAINRIADAHKKWTGREISRRIGVSHVLVNDYRKTGEHPVYGPRVRSGDLTPSAAVEMLRAEQHIQEDLLVEHDAGHRHTVQEIRAIRRASAAAPASAVVAPDASSDDSGKILPRPPEPDMSPHDSGKILPPAPTFYSGQERLHVDVAPPVHGQAAPQPNRGFGIAIATALRAGQGLVDYYPKSWPGQDNARRLEEMAEGILTWLTANRPEE